MRKGNFANDGERKANVVCDLKRGEEGFADVLSHDDVSRDFY